MTGGLIYKPSDTQAPADDLAPAEGPLLQTITAPYDIAVPGVDIVDLYDIRVQQVITDLYDVIFQAAIVDLYDIWIPSIDMVDIYDIKYVPTITDLYDIQIDTQTIQDYYDIRVHQIVTDYYDIQLSLISAVDIYDIQVPSKDVSDLYDIQIPAETIIDLYDIQVNTQTIVDLYDIQVPSLTIQDYYDIQLAAITIQDYYDIFEPTWDYYYVNGVYISDYILATPGVSWSGYTPKLDVIRHARTSRDSEMMLSGWDPLSFKASLLLAGTSGELNNQTVRAALADEDGNYTAYLGRNDRFYNVTATRLLPTWSPGWRGVTAKYDLELTFEEPWSWESQSYSTWSPGSVSLPQTSTGLSNADGEDTAPIYSASVTGHYSGGNHLTNVYLKLYNASSVLVASIELADQLLSEEVVELDRLHRYLTLTYSDSYATSTVWTQDATQSGCTCSGGQVSVPSTKYYYYRFMGPHPQIASEGIKLTATITVGAGSPIIQYSTDGTNWYTSVSAADIAAGSGKSTVYYLNGTSLQSDIYIRFYSPSGASMTVQDVEFVSKRDIQGENVLEIPAGSTYTVTVEGDGSASATPTITFRPKYYPQ